MLMAKITRANLQEYFDKIEAQMQLMDDVVEFNFPDNDEKEQADKVDMVNCMAYDWACRNMIENSWLIEAFTVYATLSICPDIAKPLSCFLLRRQPAMGTCR